MSAPPPPDCRAGCAPPCTSRRRAARRRRREDPPREWRSLALRRAGVVEEGAEEPHSLGGALLRMNLHADRASRSHGVWKAVSLVLGPRGDDARVGRPADEAVRIV